MNRRGKRRVASALGVVGIAVGLVLGSAGQSAAHPLGNFTTNTSLEVRFHEDRVAVTYLVDMAELPALKVRQQLDQQKLEPSLQGWAQTECAGLAKGITVGEGDRVSAARFVTSTAAFEPGQAGLNTLRLTCVGSVNLSVEPKSAVVIDDANYGGRAGWREVVIPGAGRRSETSAPSESPSGGLRTYTTSTRPPRQLHTEVLVNQFDPEVSSPQSGPTSVQTIRQDDGLSSRFQSLVAERADSPLVILSALLIALVLGAGHALAPGHGKSLMAAYVVGRRGGRRDLVAIGATVALTHTVGVLLFTSLALLSGAFSPARTVRVTGVVSGVLVIVVGLNLLRVRWRRFSSKPGHDHAGHEHAGHDHAGHDHAGHEHAGHEHAGHEHAGHDDHRHDHGHQPTAVTRRSRFGSGFLRPTNRALLDGDRWIVTEHAHGGGSHTHVLPQPGADVSRRELVAMGVAGGLVPSPSALLVLLGAIALHRVGFGLALIVAYGVGLALTLIAAGLLMAHLEHTVRRLSSRSRGGAVAAVVAALPLVSACGLIGGGALFVLRAAQI